MAIFDQKSQISPKWWGIGPNDPATKKKCFRTLYAMKQSEFRNNTPWPEIFGILRIFNPPRTPYGTPGPLFHFGTFFVEVSLGYHQNQTGPSNSTWYSRCGRPKFQILMKIPCEAQQKKNANCCKFWNFCV